MTFVHTFLSIAALASATLATSAWAATVDQHDSHHPAQTTGIQVAQATPASPGMGMGMGTGMGMGMGAGATMPGYADQMKAMHEMHDRMMAAKTPEERRALMAENMKLMQGGMSMMGGMGGMGAGAMMADKPGDMAARQALMEQRMGMMQSMMQMMVDRMQAVPATQ